ncbi:MAG TPA: PD-(D/E)XK nuclease family protein [Flavobacteriales bacterium]|nr:PD-(D/E)XK nuclease family protein [Flavobacteriales bacterium]HRE97252.1 PD-(D/E)XK nuclease family protein [Flavobacteriales bacterium]HRJ38470.1 PD-(D/E)XK nuclease family protein [Flavobacteriales bacterium]
MRFLEEIAKELIAVKGSDFSSVVVVLPSKRGGLFLRKHLASQLQKAFIPPLVSTPTELFSQWSKYRVGDPMELMFLLFESYQSVLGNRAEPFDRYLRWGQMLQTDFNDIDRYLVDTRALFRDLRNIKAQEIEIEGWSFEGEDLSRNQERYLEFWNEMPAIYAAYKKRLQERGLAYGGMLYRDVAENVAERVGTESKEYWFAGFNALSTAEQVIINHLCETEKAQVFFDADPFYLDDKDHEAGMFLRRFRTQWKGRGFSFLKEHFKSEKSIEILNVPGNVAQARIAGQILSEEGGGTETALVLANEQLLLPVLNSLPEVVDKVNVTMGFPLRSSDLFQLYLLIIELQRSRIDANGKDKGGVYYRPFLELLFHPVIRQYLGREASLIRDAVHRERRVFVTDKDIERYGGDEFASIRFLLKPWGDFPSDALRSFVVLNDLLRDFYLHRKKDKLALEYVFHLSSAIDKLKVICEKYPYVTEFHSFRTLLRNYVSQLDISFLGEPLDGLQLMGMLETRGLDFEKVILLSVNEDVLPKSRWEHSFILYELKRYYGLPTYKERDAVYAHHFFRLLQRADKVWLIYNSDPENFSSGEKSRFVLQLQEELPKYYPKISIRERIVQLPMDKHDISVSGIEKTEEIINRIKEHLQSGVSPSALNKFVTCPLDYYYRYVLGIKEDEELDEVSDHAVVGTVVHGVLEQQYKELIGKEVNPETVKQFRKESRRLAREELKKHAGSVVEEGAYYLLLQVAMSFLDNFYEAELDTLETNSIQILSIEEKLSAQLEVDGLAIKISGKADRIDVCNGVLRIIDYKTGKFESKDVSVKVGSEILDKGKALQLLAYAWMRKKMNQDETLPISAGIFPLRNSEEVALLEFGKSTQLNESAFTAFEDAIRQLVGQLLDPAQAFVHDPDSRHCSMCE